MKKISFIICILFIFSCKKNVYKEYYDNGSVESVYELKYGKINGKGIYYNEDGSVKRILYFKDGIRDSISTEYYDYKSNRVKVRGFYNYGIKQGWWFTYDSSLQEIIEEKYYHGDEIYTYTKYDINGKCTYNYIRPIILDDRDTLYVSQKDSVGFIFNNSNSVFDLKKYIIVVLPDTDRTVNAYVLVNSIPNKHIYFDDSNVFKKNILYFMELQFVHTMEEKLCICDSIEYGITSKYVYVR